MTDENKDPELWKMAQRRAAFKYHVLIYFIMNLFFWTMWYISLKNNPTPPPVRIQSVPWPVWPMVGWGIAVILNYISVYHIHESQVEKEYQKLRNKQ